MITSKTKAAFVGLAAAAALSVGVTQALSADDEAKSAPQASACLDSNFLTTRMVVNGNTLFIEDMSGQGAVLEMAPPCSNMHDLDMIGFEFRGSSKICGRTDIKVVHNTPNGAIPAKCIVKTYTPLNREEAKAYLSEVKKK